MNNYEFGGMVYKCPVYQMRNKVLRSIKAGGGASEAVNGFVNSIRKRSFKCRAETTFLAQFDSALAQLPIEVKEQHGPRNAT